MTAKNTSAHLLLSVLLCGLSLFFFRCSGSKSNESVSTLDSLSADTTQGSPENDLSPVDEAEAQPGNETEENVEQSASWDESLEKYFTPEQVIIVKNAKAEFESMKTAADMAQYYKSTLPSIREIVGERIRVSDPDVYSGDDSPKAHWEWFAEYYPAIYFSVDCSECMYEPYSNMSALIERANRTEGKEDELFLELQAIVSTVDYRLVGCHFCAAYTLGDNREVNILKALEEAAPAQALFGDLINEYRSRIVYVVKEFYYYDKPKVLAEIDQMLKSKILTPDELNQLKESRDRLASAESGAQFNCGTANCNWGSVEN